MLPDRDLVVTQKLEEYRLTYGSGTYVTVFTDGLVVPWRPLPLHLTFKYAQLVLDGYHSEASLEDEIFIHCVLEGSLKRQIDYLKAGVVTETVRQIMSLSGPSSATELEATLERQRLEIAEGHNAIVHEFVKYITMAFTYTPTEVYQMNFNDMLRVFVLAERKLLAMGIIPEPLKVQTNKPESQPLKQRKPDPRKVWEQIHGISAPDDLEESDLPVPVPSVEQSVNWREKLGIRQVSKEESVSPIIQHWNKSGAKKIDFGLDNAAILATSKGHELTDLDITQEQMIEEAKKIYAPVVRYLEERKKK